MTGPVKPPPLRADPLRWGLWWIAVFTAISGLVLIVAGGPILDVLDADRTTLSTHFFGIVGMFMLVVGALSVQAYADDEVPEYVIVWSALQKLGAAVAVGAATFRDLFSSLALLIAGFDLLTGVAGVVFLQRLRAARRAAGTGTS